LGTDQVQVLERLVVTGQGVEPGSGNVADVAGGPLAVFGFTDRYWLELAIDGSMHGRPPSQLP
jgi:hypothetical protein